jgi:hypothetical protein
VQETIEMLTNEISELKSQMDSANAAAAKTRGDRITVVIPYVKQYAQGNELQLALRGWAENFKENFNIVIVGDREKWMDATVGVIDCPVIGQNPPLDIAKKLLKVIGSDLVTDKFIWANDDQYLISPCMLADFEFLKCSGKLVHKKFGSTLYQHNKQRTFSILKSLGLGTWDFSTHTPIVYEKQKLQKLIDDFQLTKEPYLIATLYFNRWFEGFIPYMVESREALEYDNLKVGVYRKNADLDRLKNLMTKKKIVSNSESGYTEELSVILNKRFPVKCKFEK